MSACRFDALVLGCSCSASVVLDLRLRVLVGVFCCRVCLYAETHFVSCLGGGGGGGGGGAGVFGFRLQGLGRGRVYCFRACSVSCSRA